jgi:16S rRNA processing protein RimM
MASEGRPAAPVAAGPSSETGLVRIGTITGAHGLKGVLRFRADNPDKSALESVKRVYLESAGVRREYRLLSAARKGRGTLRIEIEGVTDVDAANALRGATLMVAAADLPPPAPGGFYYYQVIGMEVRLGDGRLLGKVEEVFFTGANDVWVVRGAGDEVLVPVIADVVKSIDLEARRATIEAIPGLLD